jgi:hypothetical protein
MSQDLRTNSNLSATLTEAPVQSWSADTYADQLMNDLFSDIDHILEGGSKLPNEPVTPEYVSLQSILIPQINLPEPPTPPPTPQPTTPKASETSSQQRDRGWGLDKILLGLACVSVAATSILWLAGNQKLKGLKLPFLKTTAPTAQNQLTSADTEFTDYMLRSLSAIDRKAQVSKQSTTVASIPPLSNQQVVLVPGNLAQTNRSVMERVYIPVYQPPLTPSGLPALPPTVTVVAPPVAQPTVATAPSVKPKPKPVAPAASAAPSAPSAAPSVAPTTAVAGIHTLVGFMEGYGALFDINGVVQRITIGEGIGSSGWTLVTVTSQEAVIRRNGEVRSIYAGQNF